MISPAAEGGLERIAGAVANRLGASRAEGQQSRGGPQQPGSASTEGARGHHRPAKCGGETRLDAGGRAGGTLLGTAGWRQGQGASRGGRGRPAPGGTGIAGGTSH
jgi:hypothetical protein